MSTEFPSRIGTLIVHGREHGLWSGAKTCLEQLGLKTEHAKRAMKKNEDLRRNVQERLEKLLREKNVNIDVSDVEGPLPETFRGLVFLGMRLQLWDGFTDCGRGNGLSYDAVTRYVHTPVEELTSTARGKMLYKQATETLRQKVLTGRKKLREKMSKTQHEPADPASAPQAAQEEVTVSVDGPLREPDLTQREHALVQFILQKIQAEQAADTAQQAAADSLRPSDWKEQLIAGGFEIAPAKNASLRFLLPSQLVPNSPKFTKEELRDSKELVEKTTALLHTVNLLLAEVRRRLQLSCQSRQGREQGVEQLLRPAKQLLMETAAIGVILQALQECDLEGNLQEYHAIFERHFRSLLPPKLT